MSNYHQSLQVQEVVTPKGTDYSYVSPFVLKDKLGAAYEAAKAEGKKVFRRWDGENKRWIGNAVWLEIVSGIVASAPPAPARAPRPWAGAQAAAPVAVANVNPAPSFLDKARKVCADMMALESDLNAQIDTASLDNPEAVPALETKKKNLCTLYTKFSDFIIKI